MRRRPGPAPLIALSGMDGAGKSTAAGAIIERLREEGYPVKPMWHRLGEMATLGRVAGPVKRVMRPRRPVAGSVEDGVARRRGLVAWAWVLVVSLEAARSHLITAGITRWGIAVVSDRWTTDALVDLNVRYGRHRPAEWLLRVLAPRAHVSVLLDIDAETAAARKPDDQPRPVLEMMEGLYGRAARATRVRRIDATRPRQEVLDELLALVDAALPSDRADA
jgi:thymidylate kinase